MPKFKEGERVRIKARQASEKEVLEGRYAPYLANATGTILKVYDAQQIAVNLDIDSLPEEVRQRHAEQQETMYRRWFDSLSEEARNRLTDEEKAFRLNYVVLVAESDLESLPPAGFPRTRGKPTPSKTVPPEAGGTSRRGSKQPKAQPAGGRATGKPKAERQDAKATKGRASQRAEAKQTASRKPRKQSETAQTSPTPARPTPEQLDLMEEAYLKARQRKAR